MPAAYMYGCPICYSIIRSAGDTIGRKYGIGHTCSPRKDQLPRGVDVAENAAANTGRTATNTCHPKRKHDTSPN